MTINVLGLGLWSVWITELCRTCFKCLALYNHNKWIVPVGSEVRACCRYSEQRKSSLCVQLKSFLHVSWSFPLNNLLQFSFHVTHHHMIYRQASTCNYIALITFHSFYSLLLFSLLSQYFSYDLLDQSFLSPFIKIPLATAVSCSEQAEPWEPSCLGSAAFWGLCTSPLPLVNAHFATYLLPAPSASLSTEW